MKRRALLISAAVRADRARQKESLDELERLAETAFVDAAGKTAVKLRSHSPSTFVGKGRLDALKDEAAGVGADLVIFDDEITPVQERNLENFLRIPVMTRSRLILEIFSRRARTREGKLQVKLAELSYLLSRLSGKGATLSQQRGIIGARGPGEKKMETQKRVIRDNIAKLKKEIKAIKKERDVQRRSRFEVPAPQVSIVGYTNAGKSTLLNRLTGGARGIYVDDNLFATLDPLVKRVRLPSGSMALFSDTVGFIQKLPHDLIAAFRATMEEISYSDLIVHLHDLSSDNLEFQHATVEKTISELNGENPVAVINAYNKTDLAGNAGFFRKKLESFSPVFISAKTGEGVGDLLRAVEEKLGEKWKPRKLRLPAGKYRLLGEIYRTAINVKAVHKAGGVTLEFAATDGNYERIKNRISGS